VARSRGKASLFGERPAFLAAFGPRFVGGTTYGKECDMLFPLL
jgi:hypothetical protein